jgi:hypothetical protein
MAELSVRRHHVVRVHRDVGLLVVLAGEQVDHLLLDGELVLGDVEADRPARVRDRMHVELHLSPPR